MHGHYSPERQVVIHDGEDSLFHLPAIPGTANNSLFFSQVEEYKYFRIEPLLLPLGIHCFGRVQYYKIRLKNLQLLFAGTNKHIDHKVGLPGHLHDKPHLQPGIFIGTTIAVHHKKTFPC